MCPSSCSWAQWDTCKVLWTCAGGSESNATASECYYPITRIITSDVRSLVQRIILHTHLSPDAAIFLVAMGLSAEKEPMENVAEFLYRYLHQYPTHVELGRCKRGIGNTARRRLGASQHAWTVLFHSRVSVFLDSLAPAYPRHICAVLMCILKRRLLITSLDTASHVASNY